MFGLVNVGVEVSGVIASPIAAAWEAVCASLGNTDSDIPVRSEPDPQNPVCPYKIY
jgi:hypothetical protein